VVGLANSSTPKPLLRKIFHLAKKTKEEKHEDTSHSIGHCPVGLAGRAFDAGAQTETNLYSFVGSPTDGANP
jgi:hypothetical protein